MILYVAHQKPSISAATVPAEARLHTRVSNLGYMYP